MKSNEMKGVVIETQDMILKGFSQEIFKARMPAWIGAMQQIASAPDDLLNDCLGGTGKRLKQFAAKANLEHPDLELFFDSIGSVGDLYQTAADIIIQARLEKETSEKVKNEEAKLLAKGNFSQIIRKLHQPRTRLLSSEKDRLEQRKAKKQITAVNLKAALSGGENSFFGRPDNFKRFTHRSQYYNTEMKELLVRLECFQSHGMPEMAHVFSKRMRGLEESISETCGFYKLKPDEASVCLARLHGFRWTESGSVVASSKFFDGVEFWPEGSLETGDDPQIEHIKRTLILQTKFVPSNTSVLMFNYQPRMYPLSHFPLEMPNKTKMILENAEKFCSLGNHPFFDYFWVLVPTVSVSHPALQKSKDQWMLRINGANHVFYSAEEATVALDKILVSKGCVVPVIIGERDGSCYFLSMWN